jgi:hypothetical protein
MGRYFRNARFAIVFLLILLVGRLVLGARGVPYEKGTWFFSMVTFSVFASIFYGGFSRRLWNFKLLQGVLSGTAIGLSAQILIFLATMVSYLLGAETYFNSPIALNQAAAVGIGQAVGIRLGGLVANTILNSIAALIGWAVGALIPEKS